MSADISANDDSWITPENVRGILGISNQTIRRRRKNDAEFPKPVFLTPYSTRYKRSEVLAYKAKIEAEQRARVAHFHPQQKQECPADALAQYRAMVAA